MTGKLIFDLLNKYCISHSSRRINFLYWNTIDIKEQTLHLVNVSGKLLTRVNNSDLIYRIVHIKSTEDFSHIVEFFTQYIVDPEDPRACYVVRVDFLSSYLKSIDYDLSKMNLQRNVFSTVFHTTTANDKESVRNIAVIDVDIQSLFLIEHLYQKYSMYLFEDGVDSVVTDIRDVYIEDTNFKYTVPELGINIVQYDALDIVSRKFVTQMMKDDVSVTLEQLYIKNGMTSIVNRYRSKDLDIVTVRVYVQLFLRKYIKRGKK